MQDLMEKMHDCNAMRRDFRHLHQNFNNIVNKKSKVALIGSISWIAWPDPSKLEFLSCVLKRGFVNRTERLAVINPSGLRLSGPVSHVRFEAFGIQIEFNDLMVQFSDWMMDNFSNVKLEVEREFEKIAADSSIKIEDLWNSSGSELFLALEFKI